MEMHQISVLTFHIQFFSIFPILPLSGWAGSMALYELAIFDPSDPVLDPMCYPFLPFSHFTQTHQTSP